MTPLQWRMTQFLRNWDGIAGDSCYSCSAANRTFRTISPQVTRTLRQFVIQSSKKMWVSFLGWGVGGLLKTDSPYDSLPGARITSVCHHPYQINKQSRVQNFSLLYHSLPSTSNLSNNASHKLKHFPGVYFMTGRIMTQLAIAPSSKGKHSTFLENNKPTQLTYTKLNTRK